MLLVRLMNSLGPRGSREQPLELGVAWRKNKPRQSLRGIPPLLGNASLRPIPGFPCLYAGHCPASTPTWLHGCGLLLMGLAVALYGAGRAISQRLTDRVAHLPERPALSPRQALRQLGQHSSRAHGSARCDGECAHLPLKQRSPRTSEGFG